MFFTGSDEYRAVDRLIIEEASRDPGARWRLRRETYIFSADINAGTGMKNIRLLFQCLMLSALLGIAGVSHAADGGFRSNGSNWFEFGPAVIRACKSVEFHPGFEPGNENPSNDSWAKQIARTRPIRVSHADPRFGAVQRWLQQNVEPILNCSPTFPTDGSSEVHDFITLFSSENCDWPMTHLPRPIETAPTSKAPDHEVIIGPLTNQHVLLIVPLTKDTLGDNWLSKLDDLKKLMQRTRGVMP
jgi:hypothetical protein